MNKCKILFVIDALRKGGIRTSLLNLLSNLDYKKYEVHLFAFHLTNDDLKDIPWQVKVIKPNKLFDIVASTGEELRKKSSILFLIRSFFSVLCRFLNSSLVYKYIFKSENRLFQYDVAISYTNNVGDHSLYFGANKFVIEKVIAQKKITWLHADYEMMKLNTKINNSEYKFFDAIITVSDEISKKFLVNNPDQKEKVKTIYNLIDESELINKSKVDISETFNDEILNIITIARLDDNKDPYKIITIAKQLRENGMDFIWRIIGDGPLFSNMKLETKKENLTECLKWYGYIDNPYPYLKNSDLYVSTSKSEGYSLSVVEALFFSVPVLCGYYDSVYEILSTNTSWIVDNNVEAYLPVLYDIFKDRNVLENMKGQVVIKHNNRELLRRFDEVVYV